MLYLKTILTIMLHEGWEKFGRQDINKVEQGKDERVIKKCYKNGNYN